MASDGAMPLSFFATAPRRRVYSGNCERDPMQSVLPANACCKNRRARKHLVLHMATTIAVLWSTAALGSLSGAQSVKPFVNPARREQPRHVDEARAISFQPLSVKGTQGNFASANAEHSRQPTVHVTANWHTSLTMHSQQEDLTQKSETIKELLIPDPSRSLPRAVDDTKGADDEEDADKKDDNDKDDGGTKGLDCQAAPPLSTVTANIGLPSGKLPTNAYAKCAEQTHALDDRRAGGGWMAFEHHWSATCMRHRPLYFEEVNAERYGYTPSYLFQPVISAGRFFATIPALPYKMAIDHPRECKYTLGHYRPGSCNPWRRHQLPRKLSASAVEVGFIAAMILIFP